jgi:hypothetical protein
MQISVDNSNGCIAIELEIDEDESVFLMGVEDMRLEIVAD